MITESLIDEDAWAEAPADAEEAFLFLIARAKAKLLQIENGALSKGPYSSSQWRRQYINEVATIASELGISGISSATDATSSDAKMDAFDALLARLVTRARVRNRDLLRVESVELPSYTKSDIRKRIEALRASIAASNLSENLKERLHKKIDVVEAELEKKRFDMRTVWLLAGAVGAAFGGSVQTLAALPEAVQTVREISSLVETENLKQVEQEQALLCSPPLQIEDKSSPKKED